MKFIKKIALMAMSMFATCSQIVNNVSAYDYFQHIIPDPYVRCNVCGKDAKPDPHPILTRLIEPNKKEWVIKEIETRYMFWMAPSKKDKKIMCSDCMNKDEIAQVAELMKNNLNPDYDIEQELNRLKSDENFRNQIPYIVPCGRKNLYEGNSTTFICPVCFEDRDLKTESYYEVMFCRNCGQKVCGKCLSKVQTYVPYLNDDGTKKFICISCKQPFLEYIDPKNFEGRRNSIINQAIRAIIKENGK